MWEGMVKALYKRAVSRSTCRFGKMFSTELICSTNTAASLEPGLYTLKVPTPCGMQEFSVSRGPALEW